jgi:trehalose 6-phosphate synthase/phosphatase
LNEEWKQAIRPIVELYRDRTPGSLVEEKDFSLVWHYRQSDPTLAAVRMQELRGALASLTENIDVGLFEGNKIIEVRRYGISKGRAAQSLIASEPWDFLFAVGDDYTDEEMFAALPESAYSIKVGQGVSKARFNIDTVHDVRTLVRRLADLSEPAVRQTSPSHAG